MRTKTSEMGLGRLEFLLLFFFLLSSSNNLEYPFVSALNEEQSAKKGGIWENHSSETRLVGLGEVIVDHRGAAASAGAHGGTGYSSNSAMNHGNNNDNKPSDRHKSDSCTISHIGLTHFGFLLLSSIYLV